MTWRQLLNKKKLVLQTKIKFEIVLKFLINKLVRKKLTKSNGYKNLQKRHLKIIQELIETTYMAQR